jgi:hypothetical protein
VVFQVRHAADKRGIITEAKPIKLRPAEILRAWLSQLVVKVIQKTIMYKMTAEMQKNGIPKAYTYKLVSIRRDD